jgi:hypothetical protein
VVQKEKQKDLLNRRQNFFQKKQKCLEESTTHQLIKKKLDKG